MVNKRTRALYGKVQKNLIGGLVNGVEVILRIRI